MASTHELISRNLLSSATSTLTFSSIPQTYTDLNLVISAQTSASGHTVWYRFNGLTTSVYSGITMGFSTATYSQYYGAISSGILAYSNNGFTTARMSIDTDIFNYTDTTAYKSLVTQAGQGNGEIEQTAGTFLDTGAITSFTIYASGGPNFESGSVFSLYGIRKA